MANTSSFEDLPDAGIEGINQKLASTLEFGNESVIGDFSQTVGGQGDIHSLLPNMEFPIFDGSHPRIWINQCNNYFKLFPTISDVQRIDLAIWNFEGKAFSWILELPIDDVLTITWKQFCEVVCSRFDMLKISRDDDALVTEIEFGKKSYPTDEAPKTVTGDIVFVLQQKEHPKFKRKSDDLFIEHSLSLTEALCGFQFILSHLDGRQLLIKSQPGEVVGSRFSSSSFSPDNDDELASIVEHVDKDNNGIITFEEWRDFLLLYPHEATIENIYHYWEKVYMADIGEQAVITEGINKHVHTTQYLIAGVTQDLVNSIHEKWKTPRRKDGIGVSLLGNDLKCETSCKFPLNSLQSICPSILGHELVKARITLPLFGSTRKHSGDENKVHIVVGDPGLVAVVRDPITSYYAFKVSLLGNHLKCETSWQLAVASQLLTNCMFSLNPLHSYISDSSKCARKFGLFLTGETDLVDRVIWLEVVYVVEFMCYFSIPLLCFMDDELVKKLTGSGVSLTKVEAVWQAVVKNPKHKTVDDVLAKFSSDSDIIAIGVVYFADVEGEWMMQPGGSIAHKCTILIVPSRLLLFIPYARKDGGDEPSQRMVPTLLNLMDENSRTDGILVIAATHRPDSKKNRENIFRVYLNRMSCNTDVCINELPLLTKGYTGANISLQISRGKQSSLLVVGDRKGAIFGGLPLIPTNKRYQGMINSFVFTNISANPLTFHPTGKNPYLNLCSTDYLAIGGGGHFALYLDGDLLPAMKFCNANQPSCFYPVPQAANCRFDPRGRGSSPGGGIVMAYVGVSCGGDDVKKKGLTLVGDGVALMKNTGLKKKGIRRNTVAVEKRWTLVAI